MLSHESTPLPSRQMIFSQSSNQGLLKIHIIIDTRILKPHILYDSYTGLSYIHTLPRFNPHDLTKFYSGTPENDVTPFLICISVPLFN